MIRLFKNKPSKTKICITLCLITILISFLLLFFIDNTTEISSEWLHLSMELPSSILSVIIGIFGVIFFINNGTIFYLIVGMGFIISGCEALIYSSLNFYNSIAEPDEYTISRLLLGILLITGLISNKKIKNKKIVRYLSVIVIPVSLLTVIILLIKFNTLVLNDILLSIIFLIATFLSIYRLYQKNDTITSFLALSTLLISIGQIYLAKSVILYDIYFVSGHIFFLFSYTLMITGLLTFIFSQYKELKNIKRILQDKEVSLEKERSQLQSIFNNIDDFIYVVDPENSKILFANKSMENSFGKKLEGKICYLEVCGQDYQCSHCLIKNNIKTSRKNHKEFNKVLNKTFSTTESYIKWPDGKDVVFHVLSDISEISESKTKLEQTLSETIRLNELMIKREKRIIEMKKEVNSLLIDLNREIKYKNTEI